MNTTEQQFSQLVRDNRSTIYAVCYMFSNDADEVADLFQEVLVKLWNGYETFHGKSDVKTWIYRVTLGSYNIVVFLTICISYANNCFTL